MRVHQCGHQMCHAKVPINIRYCKQHQQDNKQTYDSLNNKNYNRLSRDQEANTFYQSTRWAKMRNYIYSRDMGIDQITGQPILGRYITDHVHPLSIAPDEQLSSDNLWLLSTETHNVKTMIEQQLLNSPNGKNKARHVSKEWYKNKVLAYLKRL